MLLFIVFLSLGKGGEPPSIPSMGDYGEEDFPGLDLPTQSTQNINPTFPTTTQGWDEEWDEEWDEADYGRPQTQDDSQVEL